MLTKLTGLILKQPFIHTWLLKLAKRTPDTHIPSPDGSEIYMYRYWLFNPIDAQHQRKYPWIKFSVRIHHIRQPDLDRHLHDHPFNARTWIMRGGYTETRREQRCDTFGNGGRYEAGYLEESRVNAMEDWIGVSYHRVPGESTTLGYEQYHKITELDEGGALTFFLFGDYLGQWGFLVDGAKVPHRAYEKQQMQNDVVLTIKCDAKPALDELRRIGEALSAHAPAGVCLATQHSDQMWCRTCGWGWDVNDLDPPICSRTGQPGRASGGPAKDLQAAEDARHIQPTEPWAKGK